MSCATNEYYLWLVYIGYAINSSSSQATYTDYFHELY